MKTATDEMTPDQKRLYDLDFKMSGVDNLTITKEGKKLLSEHQNLWENHKAALSKIFKHPLAAQYLQHHIAGLNTTKMELAYYLSKTASKELEESTAILEKIQKEAQQGQCPIQRPIQQAFSSKKNKNKRKK